MAYQSVFKRYELTVWDIPSPGTSNWFETKQTHAVARLEQVG